jgi:hypothetical protein
MRPIAILLALCGLVFGAEPQAADMAVVAVLKRASAEIAHVQVIRRAAVTENLDLVVAIGSPKNCPLEQGRPVPWTEQQKLGLFLQEKNQRARVYSLAVEAGSDGCAVRVDRITSTDSVFACTAGFLQFTPLNHKFVYDVRAKRLVSHFSYSPFSMYRGFANAGGAVFAGSDSQRLIAIAFQPGSPQPFRVLGEVEARPWLARLRTSEGTVGSERKRVLYIEPEEFKPVHFGAFALDREEGVLHDPRLVITEGRGARTLRYELPQSTYDAFAAARPARVKDNYVRANAEIEERIGPYQVDEGKLWFGKTFYDGEGKTGVGGFGYFDPADRKYHSFAPPELADWSVLAMLVEPGAVWTALARRGEYGGPSGGVLQYDRRSGSVRKFEVPDLGKQFLRLGDDLLVATSGGVAVISGSQVARYFVDWTSDGRLRVAQSSH